MRIASLVPSATEMLFALGLGRSVVGVTHECDFPLGASDLPHLTRSVIPEGLPAAEIDREVPERMDSQPTVMSQDPSTLGEVLADIRRLGEAAGALEAADDLLEDAAERLD